MSQVREMVEEQIRETTGLCAKCKRSVPASLWEVHGQIFLRKECPEHGFQEALISSNAEWFDYVMSFEPKLTSPTFVNKDISQGCPFDCGSCRQHEQRLLLPILPITSACNLSCPICYTHNRNEDAYHMGEDELSHILEQLRGLAPEKRIINITGGEPTQHPFFERLIQRCYEEGIHRITISTHGLRFLKEPEILERLAAMDARVILSFDSFGAEVNKTMLGGNFLQGKMQVLDLLEKYNVHTTILPVLAKGLNDHELNDFLQLTLKHDFIRSLEFHTMTFTGQFGTSFFREARYTTYDVLVDLERQTNGLLRVSDFVPSPAAHPLCYLVTYMMQLEEGEWIPMTRFMSGEDLRELLSDSLYMEPDQRTENKLRDVINRIWSGEIVCEEPERILAGLKRLILKLFAPGKSYEERLLMTERVSKAIYIHAHMDEETFDTDRIKQCCVGIVGPDGSNIPSCAYNILYRERDQRFMKEPEPAMHHLGAGRKPLDKASD